MSTMPVYLTNQRDHETHYSCRDYCDGKDLRPIDIAGQDRGIGGFYRYLMRMAAGSTRQIKTGFSLIY